MQRYRQNYGIASVTQQQAVRLAVQAMERRRRQLAVDADLFETYGADYPAARRAASERRALKRAIETLQGEGGRDL